MSAWTFEKGRIALRVLWKRYHFEWGRFHVLVEWIPFKCQNTHSNLDFVSFSNFLWPDFVVASLARPLYPSLMVPGYTQVSGRRKDLFCSSGSPVSVSSQGIGAPQLPCGTGLTKCVPCSDQLFLPEVHIWCLLPSWICNWIVIISCYHKL